MKKCVIATSIIAGLLSCSVAQAVEAPTFYGNLRFSVSDMDTGYAANPNGGAGTTIENDFSAIGFKGSEKLNEYLTLVYKAEVMINSEDTDNDKPFKARDTFVGLKTDFGTVTFGKMLTAFMKAEGGVDKFNVTNTDMNRLFAGQDRMGDVIEYASPKFANTNVLVTYELEDDVHGVDVNPAGDPYAVAVLHGDKKLKKTPYFFSAGYNAGLKNEEMYRIVGQVKVADLQLGAMYQDTKDLNDENLDGSGFIIDAKYPLTAKLSVKARYGMDDSGNGKYMDKVISNNVADADVTRITDSKVTNYAVGLDYQVSKSTKLFTHYSRFDAEVDVANASVYDEGDNIFTVGMWYKF